MLSAIGLLIIGFIIIVIAAEELVSSSAHIAASFKVSPIFIGLTIVALGTSAPEIIVTIAAALEHKSHLAIGNAIGSNIANLGLVLGITCLLKPLKIQSETLYRELPILFVIMAAGYLLFLDGYFSSYDGMLLMLGLGLLIFYLFHLAQHSRNDPMAKEITEELSSECKYPYLRLLLSLILLPISAHLIISSAVDIAKIMEISEVTIGLTIIAIGTSLPEVVTSLVGIYKGEDDIALGNIIGSNMFNILAVLPFAGILSPTEVPASVNTRDIPIMFFTSILLVVLIFAAKKSVNRLSGAILLIVYIGYLCLLFTSR